MKKILSFVLSIILVLGIFTPVNASTVDTKKIKPEEAITKVTEAFKISTANLNFNYNYFENQQDRSYFDLNWSSKKDPGTSINASVDVQTGEILRFNKWDYSNVSTSRIPKYSKDEAKKAAITLAEKLQPVNFKEMKFKEDSTTLYKPYYVSDTYSFRFARQVNGVEFNENGITINIDKNTLAVRSYDYTWDIAAFPELSRAMSLETAKKIFGEKLGIQLSYELVYKNNDKEPTAILVYSLKNGNNPIDAVTGDIIRSYYGPYYGNAKESAMKAADASVQRVTPEEQKAIDNSGKYISKEKAEEAAKKYIEIDSSKYTQTYASLYTNYTDGNGSWNLSWQYTDKDKNIYNNINVNVDAITGEITSFYIGENNINNDTQSQPAYNKEQSKEIAENFLKKIQPEKFALTVENTQDYDNAINDKNPSQYAFRYVAKINNASVPFKSFIVVVNTYTGKVINYNMDWRNINLPSADEAISLEDAYKALFSKASFGLRYIKYYDYSNEKQTSQIKLTYVLDNFTGLLDGKNGTMLDYNGEPVKETKDVSFTDIKGTAAENDIKLLVEMGIIDNNGGKFEPNTAILQKDFIKLLVRSLNPYYYYEVKSSDLNNYDYYYNYAIQNKIISEKDKHPELKVTRQEAAKMIVKAMKVGFVADLSNLYVVPFKDAKIIPAEYKGYVVIISELKVIPAASGYFNPKSYVTKGSAASMIVNYMRVDTAK